MYLKIPYDKETLGSNWLGRLPHRLESFIREVNRNGLLDKGYEDIYCKFFHTRQLININPRYCILINELLDKLEVVGVWKKQLIPGTNEVLLGVKLYGYSKKEVNIAYNVLGYVLDGIYLYSTEKIQELRLLKMRQNANKRKKKSTRIDARKAMRIRIEKKLKVIEKLLTENEFSKSATKKQKLRHLCRHIMKVEKLTVKNFKPMNNPTVKSVICRRTKIIENRIICQYLLGPSMKI